MNERFKRRALAFKASNDIFTAPAETPPSPAKYSLEMNKAFMKKAGIKPVN